MRSVLTQDDARRFTAIALGHVSREYPNRLDHVLDGPDDARTPRDVHPVFYGSYDWHSCVHGFWMLARLLRLYPGMPEAAAIRALFDARLTADLLGTERDYLARASSRGFERPYGWAWLLKLAAELRSLDDGVWSVAIAPLAEAFADRFMIFWPKATYPIRTGTHGNHAFAAALARDYALSVRDDALLGLLWEKAVDWYGRDRDDPAREPGGDEFLSPALMEAECMRRLLPVHEWRTWFDAFLPALGAGRPETLFRPADVSDRSDGKIAHLDGLNLSRAWCWRGIAGALPPDDPRRALAETAAETHIAAALGHVADHYMGEHWLATFAVLALEA